MPVPFHSTTLHHILTSTVILYVIYLDQNRDRWWTIANAVMNLQGLLKHEFLDRLRICLLLKADCALWH
jgi:hypothetical protein